jgi:uncharacterized protein (DUF2342 family)
MDEATPQGGPFGSGDIWNDVPLFREIQRVLLSSSGPVNWELARQVGIATASSSGEDPHPGAEDLRGFEDAVRLAELQVAGFTGLEPPGDLPKVEAVRRTEWVERNLEGLRVVMEPAAVKLGEAVGRAQRELLPEGAETAGVEQLLTQLSPLLLGTQVGTVLGTLGQQVLGQYDIAIPRPGGAALLFVVPNIARFEKDWGLDTVPHESRSRSPTASSSRDRGPWSASASCWTTTHRRCAWTSRICGNDSRRSIPPTPRRCARSSSPIAACSDRCSTTSSG